MACRDARRRELELDEIIDKIVALLISKQVDPLGYDPDALDYWAALLAERSE